MGINDGVDVSGVDVSFVFVSVVFFDSGVLFAVDVVVSGTGVMLEFGNTGNDSGKLHFVEFNDVDKGRMMAVAEGGLY